MTIIERSMLRISNQKTFSDYLFWISVLLYLDPGGYFLQLSNIRFSKMFFLFVIWGVFINVAGLSGIKKSLKDKNFKRAFTISFLFLLYYIFVFIIIQDDYTPLSISSKLIKSRLVIIGWTLILPVYYFSAYRSIRLFIKLFLISSVIVAFLVILSLVMDIQLIFTHSGNRGYVDVMRILLDGYGLIELGLYLLIAVYIIPKTFYFKARRNLIISSLSIYLVYLLTLTRRYIIFVAISVGAAYFISKYVFRRGSRFQSRIAVAFMAGVIIVALFFNDYLGGIKGSIVSISITKEKGYGSTYDRISLFQHTPTIKLFTDNMVWGSGYQNEYYATMEDATYGLEGSDYVFLSSLAMFGLVGVFLFLPFYISLYSTLIKGMKIMKYNIRNIHRYFFFLWPSIIIFMATALFFIKHLLSYPNWFSFFGPNSFFEMYFIFAGLLFGSLKNLENSLLIISNSKIVDIENSVAN